MKLGNFFTKALGSAMILAALACPIFTSCYDDSALNNRIDGVVEDMENLAGDVNQLKSDLAALKTAVEKKLVVNELKTISDGYELVFSDGTTAVIKNGAKGDKGDAGAQGPQGEKGEDGDAFFESVELSADGCYLVITLIGGTVYELPMGGFNLMFTLPDANIEAGKTIKVTYQVTGAAATDDVVVRILNKSNCDAVVLAEENAVEICPDLGAGYVDLYAINNTTGELKAKTISFDGYTFTVSTSTYYVSPAGGDVEIPVTTSMDYEVKIEGSWLTHKQTKSVREETIVLTAAEANTSTTDNTATVTLVAGEKVLATLNVTQKNYYPEWIVDEAGEVIEWNESFDLFKNASVTGTPDVTKKGQFTFELSDDFSKGAFKINNMFMAALYYGEGYQMVSNQGGVYYADVEGDVLTIYNHNSVMSYGFTEDVVVVYDAAKKEFAIENVISARVYGDGFNRTGYLANYKAAVKVDAPAGGDDESLQALAGTWNQTLTGMSWPAPSATMTITVDGDALTITDFVATGTSVTATFEDGKIVIPAGTAIGSGMNAAGALDADVVLTLDGNTLTADDFTISGYMTISGYTAVNPDMEIGGEEEETVSLAGTWNQTLTGMSWPTPSATMTIAAEGNTLTITDFVATGTSVTATFEDGKILIPAGTAIGSGMNAAGALDADVVLTLNGNTLTADDFTISGYMTISGYTAVNPDMEVGEEPEPVEFATLVWDAAVPFGGGQDRNMTMDSEYVYVANSTGGNGAIKAISIADPTQTKDVKATTYTPSGLRNGTHAISCVRMLSNTNPAVNGGKDVLVASNLTIGNGVEKLIVYVWSNGIDADPNYFVIDSGTRRLGDKFTVKGTYQSGELYFFDYNDGNTVIRVNMTDGVAGLWGSPELAYATGRFAMPVAGASNIGECTIHPDTVFDGDGNPKAALLTTNAVNGFFTQNSGNAYVASAWGTDPKLTQTFGYNFFEHGGKDYVAYVKVAGDRASASLNIIEDVNGATDFKGTLEAQTGLFTAPVNGSGNASHGVGDCATVVIDGTRYIAVMAQNIGISLYKLN